MQDHPRFGRAVSQHEGTFTSGGWLWYAGGLCVLGAGAWINQGIQALLAGGSPLEQGALGLVALVIGAAVLFVATMRWRQKAIVYERGLVHTGVLGARELAFADVTRVQLVNSRGQLRVEAQTRDNEMVFIGLSSPEQLVAMIRNARP